MAQEKRPNRKRLTIDVPTVIHDKIKLMTIHQNSTMTRYVLHAVIEQLKRDEQFQ